MLTDAEQQAVREARGRVGKIPDCEWVVSETRIGSSWYRAEIANAQRYERLAETWDANKAQFISHAPADIHVLLRIIERLAAENEALRSGIPF